MVETRSALSGLKHQKEKRSMDHFAGLDGCGDEMMRVMLYEAAQSMLRSKKWSWLKASAMQIADAAG